MFVCRQVSRVDQKIFLNFKLIFIILKCINIKIKFKKIKKIILIFFRVKKKLSQLKTLRVN